MTYVNTSHYDLATQVGSHTRSSGKYKSAKQCCPTSIKSLIGSKFYSMRSLLKNRLITVKIPFNIPPTLHTKKAKLDLKVFSLGNAQKNVPHNVYNDEVFNKSKQINGENCLFLSLTSLTGSRSPNQILDFIHRTTHLSCTASAAAAKSLQSYLTLRDPRDGSAPGSPAPGILQARTLEWVAISFSNA